MLTLFVYLQQLNFKSSEKLIEIVNVEEENLWPPTALFPLVAFIGLKPISYYIIRHITSSSVFSKKKNPKIGNIKYISISYFPKCFIQQ